jgi:hypothetical protein
MRRPESATLKFGSSSLAADHHFQPTGFFLNCLSLAVTRITTWTQPSSIVF